MSNSRIRQLPLAGAALFALSGAVHAQTFQIVSSGDCPGEMIVTTASASPGSSVAVFSSRTAGETPIPGGACAGVETGLGNPQLMMMLGADADGGSTATMSMGTGVCGLMLQALDLNACVMSNVESLVSGFPGAVPRTGQWVSSGPGDDGELRPGTAWPDPRFTDNGDGTVTDHKTGLIWLQFANCFGEIDWDAALAEAQTLAHGSCGLMDGSVPGDWRLPSLLELQSLIDYGYFFPALTDGHPFVGVRMSMYWTSTMFATMPDYAWFVQIGDGLVDDYRRFDGMFVWYVRGGR